MSTLFELSIPVFIRYLRTMSEILKIAEKFCEEKGISQDEMASWRLWEDMQPLSYQVTGACRASRMVIEWVGDVPKLAPTEETTVPQMYARLSRTIQSFEAVDPACMAGKEEEEINVKSPRGMWLHFTTTRKFVCQFALPNFFFHVTTFYDILRNHGVPLGKMDYLRDIAEVLD